MAVTSSIRGKTNPQDAQEEFVDFGFVVEKGYFVDYRPLELPLSDLYADAATDIETSSEYQHTFSGEPTTPGADCPNCKKPLLPILRLDLTDPRLSSVVAPTRFLPLLYCWRCNVVTDVLTYRLASDGSVTVLTAAPGDDDGLIHDAPNYPDSFPGARARLLTLSEEAQKYIHDLNDDESFDDSGYPDEFSLLDHCVHQVGGEPYLINGDSYAPVVCPDCGKSMPLLATMGTRCVDPRGFLVVEVNDYVQMIFHYCANCSVVAALNESD